MFAFVLLNILGLVATSLAVLVFVPQAARTWRLRNDPTALEGVSILGQFVLIANAAAWITYAVASEAYWSGVPSLFYVPLALFVIVLVGRSRKAEVLSVTHSVPVAEAA